MSPVIKHFQRIFSKLSKSTLFGSILGFVLGGFGNIYPFQSLIIFLIVACFVLLKFGLDEFQASRKVKINATLEEVLRSPHPETLSYARSFEESHLIVGKVIEVIPHPYIYTRAKLTEMGWDPAHIVVKEHQKKFNAKEFLKAIGGQKEFDLPNRAKYSLVEAKGANTDNPTLSLELQQTDYFTVQSAVQQIQVDPSLLVKFGNIEPSKNKIPHTLSLHYVVRFIDGEVLICRRDEGIRYYPGAWSFSGEEQFSEFDSHAKHPIESLFQRAICEEILPLSDTGALKENFEIVKEIIKSMSVMSVFFEQEIGNYSLMGLYQLNIDKEDFVELYQRFVNEGAGNRDREGYLYVTSQKELQHLLFHGSCEAKNLFNQRTVTLQEDDLHPTSRFRIFRLLRAIQKRPFEKSDFI